MLQTMVNFIKYFREISWNWHGACDIFMEHTRNARRVSRHFIRSTGNARPDHRRIIIKKNAPWDGPHGYNIFVLVSTRNNSTWSWTLNVISTPATTASSSLKAIDPLPEFLCLVCVCLFNPTLTPIANQLISIWATLCSTWKSHMRHHTATA